MITEEMYLLAKKIIDAYESKQLKQAPVSGSLQLDSGLKRNDYVIYIGGRETQYLTEGEKYRLTGKLWEHSRGIIISVINDKGRRYVTKADCFKLQ